MTIITPDVAAADTEDLLNSVFDSVRDLRRELQDLKQRVRTGKDLDKTGDGKTLASAIGLLETCQKVENRLAECRNKSRGIVQGDYALDLDKARADIAGKLDRIRAASDPGQVPG
ncbi:hypothetical protein R5H30_02430 [Sulfitobacter sp. D35]|uniref:hypothetical protein n=1 Tax=Sulfitobacter sp. D35 TaxID=3083252 RepID=UPI00296EE965|nr:hypothetical protein [Sulfitobacter sp. D35]MDW4496823.1 hypothetical protein [Sulfitobacter sp. D35]